MKFTKLITVLLLAGLVAAPAPAPAADAADTSNAAEQTELLDVSQKARRFYVEGTKSFPSEPLEKKLFEKPEFKDGTLMLVSSPAEAEVMIILDRKSMTWDFTYEMFHRSTRTKLGAGKVIAWDGVRAAPGIAKQIINRLRHLRGETKKR